MYTNAAELGEIEPRHCTKVRPREAGILSIFAHRLSDRGTLVSWDRHSKSERSALEGSPVQGGMEYRRELARSGSVLQWWGGGGHGGGGGRLMPGCRQHGHGHSL